MDCVPLQKLAPAAPASVENLVRLSAVLVESGEMVVAMNVPVKMEDFVTQ